jgi:hypothetical protein
LISEELCAAIRLRTLQRDRYTGNFFWRVL